MAVEKGTIAFESSRETKELYCFVAYFAGENKCVYAQILGTLLHCVKWNLLISYIAKESIKLSIPVKYEPFGVT